MGDGVNIAARLEGVAKPGAICLSEDAYRQVKSRLDLNVSDLGATRLRETSPSRCASIRLRSASPPPSPSRRPASRGRLASGRRRARRRCFVIAGATAWYFVPVKPPATVASSSESATAAPFGVPTVAILPFANVTGDPHYDTLAQRIGQKTKDVASSSTLWRDRRSDGGSREAPLTRPKPGGQLNADYVVAGNLEAGGDALRVTFQLNDVHTGARLWSQTISPVLEKPNTAAAEAEVAGLATSALAYAVLNAEYARLSSTGDIGKTAWGCVLQGNRLSGSSQTRPRRLATAWKQRRKESRPTPMCGVPSPLSSTGRGPLAGAFRQSRRASKSAPISGTGCCRPPCAPAILRPWTAVLPLPSPGAIGPHVRRTAFLSRGKKPPRSIPTTRLCWGP